MERSYAVVWSTDGGVGCGRLDSLADGFELCGRDCRLSIAFSELIRASISRGYQDRLHGLPVLALDVRGRTPVRIASLEGAGVLHELVDCVERAGLTVGAA